MLFERFTPIVSYRSYLVRHAEAGDRHAWSQPDELRPLTDEGWRQAGALVATLAGANVDRLVSSPSVRCIQTLDALASVKGLPVETAPVLAEGAGGEGALHLLASIGPVVACSHGDVIEEVLDLLAARGVPLEGRVDETPKGATWVFDVEGDHIVARRLLPPP